MATCKEVLHPESIAARNLNTAPRCRSVHQRSRGARHAAACSTFSRSIRNPRSHADPARPSTRSWSLPANAGSSAWPLRREGEETEQGTAQQSMLLWPSDLAVVRLDGEREQQGGQQGVWGSHQVSCSSEDEPDSPSPMLSTGAKNALNSPPMGPPSKITSPMHSSSIHPVDPPITTASAQAHSTPQQATPLRGASRSIPRHTSAPHTSTPHTSPPALSPSSSPESRSRVKARRRVQVRTPQATPQGSARSSALVLAPGVEGLVPALGGDTPPATPPPPPASHSRAARTARGVLSLAGGVRSSLAAALAVVVLAAAMQVMSPSGGVQPALQRLYSSHRGNKYESRQWGDTGSGGVRSWGPGSGRGGSGPGARGRAERKTGGGGGGPPASGNGPTGAENGRVVKLLAVVPQGEPSPYKAPWDEVMLHIAQRLEWNNPLFQMSVFMEEELLQEQGRGRFMAAAKEAEILVGVQVTSPQAAKAVSQALSSIPTHVFFDSAPSLQGSSMLDGYAPSMQPAALQGLLQSLPWTRAAQAKRVDDILQELYRRHSSDDLLFVFLVLINEFITRVPEVANTAKGMDWEGLQCIGQHCSKQVMECLGDAQCKTALDCLQACSFNDQVCQYRCIVSYETPALERFSLCILQLHNCRNLNAEVPMRPDPAPMASFSGDPLTHEVAEDMFIGWIQSKPYSWIVAGGKNPAYDYFPCQHQLYFKGKGKGVLWYEPVFKAITLDGREVWRRRRYRVRRGKLPGTFHYTVLDNGVTSNEFWRILDCAEDLSFCLFYYSGAASSAGLSYSGAVLATPDGAWPEQHNARIQAALQPAGIKMWELSRVDNSNCQGAPLDPSPLAQPLPAPAV